MGEIDDPFAEDGTVRHGDHRASGTFLFLSWRLTRGLPEKFRLMKKKRLYRKGGDASGPACEN